MRDFNIILRKEEASDFRVGMVLSIAEKAFSNCVEYIEVEECSIVGPLLSWSNKQTYSYLAMKLDRAMVNGDFMTLFPTTHTEPWILIALSMSYDIW